MRCAIKLRCMISEFVYYTRQVASCVRIARNERLWGGCTHTGIYTAYIVYIDFSPTLCKFVRAEHKSNKGI